MNQQIKQLWMTALQSGKYEKGTRYLRNTLDEFCCLGILCDIFKEETGKGEWHKNGTLYEFKIGSESVYTMLPFSVSDWAGIKDTSGELKTPLVSKLSVQAEDEALWELNDTGYTFNEIANVIRAQF